MTTNPSATPPGTSEEFYKRLPRYPGTKTACDNCMRQFFPGEKISVSAEGHTFCYSDGGGGCVMGFLFSTGKIIQSRHMRFGDASLPAEKRRPNYPHIPVAKETAAKLKAPWYVRRSS